MVFLKSHAALSNSMPAIGMQLILEQDETRIGIETEQNEHAYARIGTIALKYIEECYEHEHKLYKRDDDGKNQLSISVVRILKATPRV